MLFTLRDRFESIDILRGVAALAVCFFHFSTGLPDFLADDNLLKIIGKYGHMGVQVFFIISGFIIPYSLYKGNYSTDKIITFFTKRLLRIEPAYFISIALAVLLKYVSTFAPLYRGPAFNIHVTDILYHIGYLCDIFNKDWIASVYWTLAIEFQFYILIAVCYTHLIVTNNKYVFYIGILLLNIPSLVMLTNKAYVFHFMPYFSLGIILFRTMAQKNNIIEFILLSLIFLFEIYYVFDLACAIVSICTISIILFIKKSNVVFTFLGKISFSLYLLHTMIGTRIINLSVNFTQNEHYRVAIIFLAVLISIACAYVYYLLIEKPFMKLSHRITYTNPPESHM